MTFANLYALRRDEDPTGMSGVGTVAYGGELPDGRLILRWLSAHPSTVVWDTRDDAEHVHSHAGTSPTRLEPVTPGTGEARHALAVLDAAMRQLAAVVVGARA